MFTGIIEETGKILEKDSKFKISCSLILEDIKIGDSIAVNGVCLTVTDYNSNSFTADVMNETISKTNLKTTNIGDAVNLERAMSAKGRFGGHIVSGHIDGTGTIKSIKNDGIALWFTIATNKEILKYIVNKGSVAIDGISLTVAYVDDICFKVSVIPHTLNNTNIIHKKIGDTVNLENDIIGKYVDKFTQTNNNTGITEEFLMKNGF